MNCNADCEADPISDLVDALVSGWDQKPTVTILSIVESMEAYLKG